jgi:predicted DNA-binding protein with PD1-like motif|tara:strand:- start:380 stop:598 length:219 start_codon:yes stop_codon:yes gene_type:complete
MTDSEVINIILNHELGFFGRLRMENENHLIRCLTDVKEENKISFIRAYLLGCLANDLNYKTLNERAKEIGLI